MRGGLKPISYMFNSLEPCLEPTPLTVFAITCILFWLLSLVACFLSFPLTEIGSHQHCWRHVGLDPSPFKIEHLGSRAAATKHITTDNRDNLQCDKRYLLCKTCSTGQCSALLYLTRLSTYQVEIPVKFKHSDHLFCCYRGGC